jgi:hypothetical protein
MPPKAKTTSGSLGGAAGKGSMVEAGHKSISDTRTRFGLGVPIKGFQPGANYWNQEGPDKVVACGAHGQLKLHATIDAAPTSGSGVRQVRMVLRFHVSLKLDGQGNPGVFSWVYNGVSDQYEAQTYGVAETNGRPPRAKTWFGDKAIQDAILKKANSIATSLKSTFGSRRIMPASW